MESREDEQEDDASRSPPADITTNTTTTTTTTTTDTDTTDTTTTTTTTDTTTTTTTTTTDTDTIDTTDTTTTTTDTTNTTTTTTTDTIDTTNATTTTTDTTDTTTTTTFTSTTTTDSTDTVSTADTTTTTTTTTTASTTAAASSTLTPNMAPDDQTDEEETEEEEEDGEEEGFIFVSSSGETLSSSCLLQQSDLHTGAIEDVLVSEQNSSTPTGDRPAPPSSLALSRPKKKKVLVAPALSLSLGRSESTVSDDFPPAFLSPSPEDDDDTGLDFDMDAMETPSDSESLPFPIYDLEDDLRRLGVASQPCRALGSRPRSAGSGPGMDQTELGALEREDVVDAQGTRWRCFSTGVPPQESRVNMSVLEPFLRVLSHGGYYGDGMNDIIVFSSCYLPQNSLENYQYVMDHLFRYVVGTLDLMVAENYLMVYLCAGGQKDKLPGIGWLRECYTTIDRRLRKNLKGFYVVHPTWYIKALITIIKPFISSKFSRKLRFIDSLQDLSRFIPTEHVQIPDCVTQYDQNRSR